MQYEKQPFSHTVVGTKSARHTTTCDRWTNPQHFNKTRRFTFRSSHDHILLGKKEKIQFREW